MKRLCIVTISQSVAESYKRELENIFKDDISIDILSVEKTGIEDLGDYDLYLIGLTSSEFYSDVASRIDPKKVVLSKLTYKKEDVEYLKSLDIKEALFINLSEKMALESISELHRLGVNNIKFHPFFPGAKNEGIDFAITSGEKRYAPKNLKKIIDIGDRYLNENTVSEIALKLGFKAIFSNVEYNTYVENLAEGDYSVNLLYNENYRIEKGYEFLVEKMGTGIIFTSEDFNLISINKYAKEMMKLDSIYFDKYFEEIVKKIKKGNHSEDYLIKINNEDISLSFIPLENKGKIYGYYIFLNKFYQIEDHQIKLRKQLYKKSSSSKYTYEDIITNDEEMLRIIDVAKNMSKSDLSILITGETGTGKELFAHSIHNSSNRKDYPFVAINCSAIPDNLLESELFGYKGGSFTGANKEGKKGLFEYAHGGSIFLDEIETMSSSLQSKLLRVIEEKEIMRIGDLDPINIDVRIIAASNEDIYEKVKDGEFRKDLYYRLNTLPLNIPPLRKRKGDIEILSRFFMENSNAKYRFSNESKKIMTNYTWDGNIRELKNLIEFFNYVDSDIIYPEYFPEYIKEKFNHVEFKDQNFKDIHIDILKILISKDKGIGRGKLLEELKESEKEYSEGEVRAALRELSDKNLIISHSGRKGSIINLKELDNIRGIIG